MGDRSATRRLRLAAGATLDTTRATAGDRIEVMTPQQDGEYYVNLRVTDALGRTDHVADVFRVVDGRKQVVDLATSVPRACRYRASAWIASHRRLRTEPLSSHHHYYRDELARGARSPYYDWFERDNTGEVTHYFDWTHLLDLDYDNPEVRNYITAALARFVRDYDVDGFRVDASWAVARRAQEFWPSVRAELKRIDPDIFLLAEASAREPYHVANGFDAAYD